MGTFSIAFCERLVIYSKKKNETAEQINTSLYTDVVFFFFSFFSRTSASEDERGARERKIKNFLLLHPEPLPLAVSKSPAVFVFYHARSMDFEEKIEGL